MRSVLYWLHEQRMGPRREGPDPFGFALGWGSVGTHPNKQAVRQEPHSVFAFRSYYSENALSGIGN